MRPLVSLLVVVLAVGCAQTVRVKVEPPGASVKLGQEDAGVIGEEGKKVEVPVGLDDVPYALERDGRITVGVVERSEVSWGWVAGGVLAAACCVPSLALGGACLANPALVTAGLGCLLAQSPAPCCAVLAAPSWATLPLAGAGALVGGLPLSLSLFAEQVPDKLVLTDAPMPPPPGEMAW